MFNIKEIRILRQYGLARLCRIKYDNNKLEYTPRILYESEIKHLITVVPKFIATRFLSEEFNEYSLLNVKNGILFIKYTNDYSFFDKISEINPKIVIITDGIILIKKSRKFIDFMINLREKISMETLIYLAFTPVRLIPILAYLGVDLFDYEEIKLQAYKGKIFIDNEFHRLLDLEEIPCKCNICVKKKKEEMGYDDLIQHGKYVLERIVINVRESLRKKRFREFLEYFCSGNLKAMEYLRIIDEEWYKSIERYVGLY